jgi:hypothetical protein
MESTSGEGATPVVKFETNTTNTRTEALTSPTTALTTNSNATGGGSQTVVQGNMELSNARIESLLDDGERIMELSPNGRYAKVRVRRSR